MRSATAHPSTEPRVLIVDDDDTARGAAAAALRDAGFVVDEVANGLDAIKAFEATRPHIALLEVMTPFVDGYSICRAIRDLSGGDSAAVVMMTDMDDIDSLRFGYEAGATDFITKPINPFIVQHRMRYMLRATELMDELRRSERKIAHLAYHDALTGLPNRRSLERYMARLVQSAPNSQRGAVFLLDLDGFKRVNDTLGHTAGDELICEVGRRVTAAFHIAPDAGDAPRALGRILARLGGDEFVFIDPDAKSADEAVALADRMLAAVGESFDLRGHRVVITASIGVALVSEVGADIETLIQSADSAMYDAKAHDRNNARFYSAVLQEKAKKQLDIENALRSPDALAQLELYYQPKVDARTARVVGAEALLRWIHPERGVIPPADFIGVVEESGLIVPIGRHVFRKACEQARRWQDIPHLRGLRIAVNVSARQFRDPHFFADVKRILEETGADPRALEIEITEGTLMNDAKAARAVLDELKKLGVWVALDDFGTGYSSLGYLRQFPFDTLKVDRSFVQDLLLDEQCAAITGAIIAMANQLHLHVVAEGVETAEQLARLQTMGCDAVQGYYFSRPVPSLDFENWTFGRMVADEVLVAPRQFSLQQTRMSAIPPIPTR